MIIESRIHKSQNKIKIAINYKMLENTTEIMYANNTMNTFRATSYKDLFMDKSNKIAGVFEKNIYSGECQSLTHYLCRIS